MTYGYPGSTNRYESSYGVKLKTDINNPALVDLRDMRLKYMLAEMKKRSCREVATGINLCFIANYWKFFDGERKQLMKFDIYEQKESGRIGLPQWANGKPEYEYIFSDWEKAYEAYTLRKHRMFINEGILGSPLLAYAATLMQVEAAMVKQGSSSRM